MPQQHSDESTQQLREEIQAKSDQYPGGESAQEMQARIAKEHAERLKSSVEGKQLSHVPEEEVMSDAMGYTPDPPRATAKTEVPMSNVIQFSGKAGEILKKCAASGEPVFILRAKDIFSTMIIAKYLEIVEAYGPSDHGFQQTIADTLQDFKDWQGANTDKVRYPD